jgi:hypothetical protein
VEQPRDASLDPAPTDCPAAPLGTEWGRLFDEATPCSSVPFPLPEFVVAEVAKGPRCAYRAPHILLSEYLKSRIGWWSDYIWLGNCLFACNGGTVFVVSWGTGFEIADPICPANVRDHQTCQQSTESGNGECVVPSEKNDFANGVVDGQVCACDWPGPLWRCVSVSQLEVPPLP